jgi:hypothetical protein
MIAMIAAITLAWLGCAPAPELPPPRLVDPLAPSEPVSTEPSHDRPSEPDPPEFDPAELERALARLPAGPTLAEVQRAALAQAGIDPATAARWLRRSRTAAILPTVSVQYDRRFDRGWVLDQAVGDPDELRNDSGQQDVLKAKATWELDRLIFSPDELRAARAVLDVADFRERLLVEITQLYFERERILLERELAPPMDLEAAIDLSLRLREVEGLLAGLTGLDFSPEAAPRRARRSRAHTRRDLGNGSRE